MKWNDESLFFLLQHLRLVNILEEKVFILPENSADENSHDLIKRSTCSQNRIRISLVALQQTQCVCLCIDYVMDNL